MDWVAETLFKFFDFWELVVFSILANVLPFLMPKRGKYIRESYLFQWQRVKQLWYRFPLTPMNKFEEDEVRNVQAIAESDAFVFQLIVIGGYFALIFVLGLLF